MAWPLMPIGRRAESNHIRLLRPPHKRVGCKISVLRRASPTVIAITKFIVVYHRQEPKLRAPNTFNLLKVIGIAWATLPSPHTNYGSSYLVLCPTENLVWFLWLMITIVSMACRGIASSLDKKKPSLLNIISERSGSSVKSHRRWRFAWKYHLLPKAFQHLSLHARWQDRKCTFSFLGSEEPNPPSFVHTVCAAHKTTRQVCWEGLALHPLSCYTPIVETGIHGALPLYQTHSFVYFSSGTSCFNDRWSPVVRSPTKERKKSGSSLSHFWKTCFSCGMSMLLSSFSVMPLLSQATSHWFLASRWQQGREHVKCSIQVLLEAV